MIEIVKHSISVTPFDGVVLVASVVVGRWLVPAVERWFGRWS